MTSLTKKDLAILKKEMERIKNDPEAQKRIQQRLAKTADHIREMKRKRRMTPEDWQQRITI